MFEAISVPGNPTLAPHSSWNPKVYSKTLENILRYNCITGYIFHRPLADEVLTGKGGTLVIRAKPTVTARSWKPGQNMVTQRPKAPAPKEFSPERFLYFQTATAPYEQMYSDIADWASLFRECGLADLLEKKEDEAFDFLLETYGIRPDANGNVGSVSSSYPVGTFTRPLAVLKNDALVAASNATCPLMSATEFDRYIEGVMLELKTEQGLTFGNSNYMIKPTWLTVRRGLSDIKAADMAGTPSSLLFRSVDTIPNPGGFSDVYRSNRVPMFTAGAPESAGDCPIGTKIWPVFYGKVAGAMEYGELKIDEQGTSETQPGKWYRHYEHYDWFARYPELFGVAWVTDTAYDGATV